MFGGVVIINNNSASTGFVHRRSAPVTHRIRVNVPGRHRAGGGGGFGAAASPLGHRDELDDDEWAMTRSFFVIPGRVPGTGRGTMVPISDAAGRAVSVGRAAPVLVSGTWPGCRGHAVPALALSCRVLPGWHLPGAEHWPARRRHAGSLANGLGPGDLVFRTVLRTGGCLVDGRSVEFRTGAGTAHTMPHRRFAAVELRQPVRRRRRVVSADPGGAAAWRAAIPVAPAAFVFLGRISFSLYLVHVPLLLAARHALDAFCRMARSCCWGSCFRSRRHGRCTGSRRSRHGVSPAVSAGRRAARTAPIRSRRAASRVTVHRVPAFRRAVVQAPGPPAWIGRLAQSPSLPSPQLAAFIPPMARPVSKPAPPAPFPLHGRGIFGPDDDRLNCRRRGGFRGGFRLWLGRHDRGHGRCRSSPG